MRTFQEQDEGRDKIPIRLSYHGKNHYNSVVRYDWQPSDALFKSVPGIYEESVMAGEAELSHAYIPNEEKL